MLEVCVHIGCDVMSSFSDLVTTDIVYQLWLNFKERCQALEDEANELMKLTITDTMKTKIEDGFTETYYEKMPLHNQIEH